MGGGQKNYRLLLISSPIKNNSKKALESGDCLGF
jgi:hypothetical protein